MTQLHNAELKALKETLAQKDASLGQIRLDYARLKAAHEQLVIQARLFKEKLVELSRQNSLLSRGILERTASSKCASSVTVQSDGEDLLQHGTETGSLASAPRKSALPRSQSPTLLASLDPILNVPVRGNTVEADDDDKSGIVYPRRASHSTNASNETPCKTNIIWSSASLREHQPHGKSDRSGDESLIASEPMNNHRFQRSSEDLRVQRHAKPDPCLYDCYGDGKDQNPLEQSMHPAGAGGAVEWPDHDHMRAIFTRATNKGTRTSTHGSLSKLQKRRGSDQECLMPEDAVGNTRRDEARFCELDTGRRRPPKRPVSIVENDENSKQPAKKLLPHAVRRGRPVIADAPVAPQRLKDVTLRKCLGNATFRLNLMTNTEKDIQMRKTNLRRGCSSGGQARNVIARRSSPPGFWRTDMPTSQEAAADRQVADLCGTMKESPKLDALNSAGENRH